MLDFLEAGRGRLENPILMKNQSSVWTWTWTWTLDFDLGFVNFVEFSLPWCAYSNIFDFTLPFKENIDWALTFRLLFDLAF